MQILKLIIHLWGSKMCHHCMKITMSEKPLAKATNVIIGQELNINEYNCQSCVISTSVIASGVTT